MTSQIAIDLSALDPNFKEHSTRGIGRYARELEKYFTKHISEEPQIGYFNHSEILEDSAVSKLIDYAPAGRVTLKQQILYPLKLNGNKYRKFDYLHFLAQMDAPSWSLKPYILSVMDLIPLVCANFYKASNPTWRFKLARFLENQSIKQAKAILTISECSKKDLINVLGVPADQIYVTPLGVSDFYFEKNHISKSELLNKYHIPQESDYLLYVGGIDPRKNLNGLLDVYAEVRKEAENNKLKLPVLVLAGKIAQDKEYARLQEKVKTLNLQDYVYETGFVDDQDLRAFYEHTFLYCFLSYYEGFGLTPLEAMAAGAAVLSSDRSAMPEVLEDHAVLHDPDQQQEIVQSILRFIKQPEQLIKYREQGVAHARKFTWEKTGEQTLAAYQQIIHGS